MKKIKIIMNMFIICFLILSFDSNAQTDGDDTKVVVDSQGYTFGPEFTFYNGMDFTDVLYTGVLSRERASAAKETYETIKTAIRAVFEGLKGKVEYPQCDVSEERTEYDASMIEEALIIKCGDFKVKVFPDTYAIEINSSKLQVGDLNPGVKKKCFSNIISYFM